MNAGPPYARAPTQKTTRATGGLATMRETAPASPHARSAFATRGATVFEGCVR